MKRCSFTQKHNMKRLEKEEAPNCSLPGIKTSISLSCLRRTELFISTDGETTIPFSIGKPWTSHCAHSQPAPNPKSSLSTRGSFTHFPAICLFLPGMLDLLRGGRGDAEEHAQAERAQRVQDRVLGSIACLHPPVEAQPRTRRKSPWSGASLGTRGKNVHPSKVDGRRMLLKTPQCKVCFTMNTPSSHMWEAGSQGTLGLSLLQ